LEQGIIKSTRQWLENVVIKLNLCPFAKRELVKNRIRFVISNATTEDKLLEDLKDELELLNTNPEIETTLLIHPKVLTDFYVYNEFLNYADDLLEYLKLDGIYQVASFHPDYQFADTDFDDVENYTNRSPYPMLHLIREESLEKAIENYPDSDLIPEHNIELIKSLGQNKMQALLQACFSELGNK